MAKSVFLVNKNQCTIKKRLLLQNLPWKAEIYAFSNFILSHYAYQNKLFHQLNFWDFVALDFTKFQVFLKQNKQKSQIKRLPPKILI